MGREVQACWQCDRCPRMEITGHYDEVPDGWMVVLHAEPLLVGGTLDAKVPTMKEGALICNNCFHHFQDFLGKAKSDVVKEALRQQIDRPAPKIADTGTQLEDYAPVEFVEDTPAVSEEERSNDE